MSRKFDPANAARLVSEERRLIFDPDAFVARLPILPGNRLADIGCGPGFLTLPMARRAAPGMVFGCDMQAAMLTMAHERAAREHVPNVHFVRVEEVGLPVPDSSLDGALCAFVIHEAEQQPEFLAEINRKLCPDGWVAVVEWQKVEGPPGPPVGERLAPDEIEQMLGDAGFTVQEAWDISHHQYARLFRKAKP